jgi:uncharacterized protein YdcH (DUF465 family)
MHHDDPAARATRIREAMARLLADHREVKARVTEYQGRRFLSPGEALELKALQRLKLHKKDAVAALERTLRDVEV